MCCTNMNATRGTTTHQTSAQGAARWLPCMGTVAKASEASCTESRHAFHAVPPLPLGQQKGKVGLGLRPDSGVS